MNTLLADAPAAQPAEHPDARRDREAAEKVYPAPASKFVDSQAPAAVQAIRAAAPARSFYKDIDQFGPGGGAARALAITINNTGSEAAIASSATAIAAIATDVGLTREDLSQFAAWAEGFIRQPPTASEKIAFQRTTVSELRKEYAGRFDDVMLSAKALVSRDPRLAKMLDTTGLADHPGVVKRFVELGQSAKYGRGK